MRAKSAGIGDLFFFKLICSCDIIRCLLWYLRNVDGCCFWLVLIKVSLLLPFPFVYRVSLSLAAGGFSSFPPSAAKGSWKLSSSFPVTT